MPAATAPVVRQDADPERLGDLVQRLVRDVSDTPHLEPVDRIAGGFRPLASTLNVALDAIWTSLRPAETAAPRRKPQANSRRPAAASALG